VSPQATFRSLLLLAILSAAPQARAVCMAHCNYASSPYPNYGCEAGAFLVTSWTVQILGVDAIVVHPVPGPLPDLIGTMDCVNSTFVASAVVAGECSVSYELSGTIDLANQWTGTFTAEYSGSCLACENQSLAITGSCAVVGAVSENSPGLERMQVIPNPSRGSASLRFYSPGDAELTLEIFDVTGRRLQTVLDRVVLPRGVHEAAWSEALESAGSSIRFARLTMADRSEMTRFVVVR
jgi:hypothetical protein